MSEMRSATSGSAFDRAGERREHPAPARPTERERGPSAELVLAGVAVLALGAWAVYHFGPDFRRYIKMERM